MTKSTPTAKALLSAIIGLVAAALIVGAISFGPALEATLQAQDLATSSQAREGFVVANASVNAALQPRVTAQPTPDVKAANYTVAAVNDEPGDDTKFESEDD